MNAFYEHHQNSIAMHNACFDRMVLDARIFGFMQPERALGFFSQNRGLFPVHKNDLVKISNDYERWVREEIQSSQCPLLEDANRKLGSPDQVSVIFGQRVTRQHNGRLQTTLDDLHLGQPILRAFYKHSILKNYVRGGNTEFGGFDRAEVGSNDVTDFRGIKEGVENLPALRERWRETTNRFREAQQDILETFLDRGELYHLSQPTVSGKKRIPGLKLDNARQLGLMHALVAFSHVLAGAFTTADLYPRVLHALGCSAEQYKLNSLRYDLSKLRAKGLVEKIPHSRRYQMTATGYRLSVVYLKVFEKLYAPLTAAVIHPCSNDQRLPLQRTTPLDRLYLAVKQALDNLVHEIGLEVGAA